MRCVLVLAVVLTPAPALAQRPPEIEPVRPSRLLAIGNLARYESTTTATTGMLYQLAFRTSRVETMPAGNRVEVHPRYYAHALATAGGRWRDGDAGFAMFGQLGVARRNDHALFTVVALAAQGIYEPRAYGPVARIEIKDNIGVQAGWVFNQAAGDGLFLSLDYMRDILRDLGLTP